MLDLAFALALENAGLGKYGDTIWFGTSPVLSDGSVSADTGVWVNMTAGAANHAVKTATITISTQEDLDTPAPTMWCIKVFLTLISTTGATTCFRPCASCRVIRLSNCRTS